jgi:hypothetical protein
MSVKFADRIIATATNLNTMSASNLLPMVEPHAAKLEACAAEMEAAGIGGDPNNGHAVHLRKMAAQMRADAVQGRLPSAVHAASTNNSAVAGALIACQEAGVRVPPSGRFTLEALNSALDAAFRPETHPMYLTKRIELKNQIFAAGMLTEESIVDVKIVKAAAAMLVKAGIPVPTTHQYTLAEINAHLSKTQLSPEERIVLKENLCAAGLMERAGTVVPLQKPGMHIARSIFAQLDLAPPPVGQKVSLGALNRAIREKGISAEKSIHIKSTLHAAGLLQD